MTSIVNIATPDKKKAFTPGKVMLHNQGASAALVRSRSRAFSQRRSD